jgi:hypothetical protein
MYKFYLDILPRSADYKENKYIFSSFLLSSICWILFCKIFKSFEDLLWLVIFWRLSNSFYERFSIFNNFSSVRIDLRVRCKNYLIRISKRRWILFNYISSRFKVAIWLECSIHFIHAHMIIYVHRIKIFFCIDIIRIFVYFRRPKKKETLTSKYCFFFQIPIKL